MSSLQPCWALTAAIPARIQTFKAEVCWRPVAALSWCLTASAGIRACLCNEASRTTSRMLRGVYPRRGHRVRRFPQKRLMMKYRDIDIPSFKASSAASGNGPLRLRRSDHGPTAIKSEAVTAAKKAIDRALAAKRERLVPPRLAN